MPEDNFRAESSNVYLGLPFGTRVDAGTRWALEAGKALDGMKAGKAEVDASSGYVSGYVSGGETTRNSRQTTKLDRILSVIAAAIAVPLLAFGAYWVMADHHVYHPSGIVCDEGPLKPGEVKPFDYDHIGRHGCIDQSTYYPSTDVTPNTGNEILVYSHQKYRMIASKQIPDVKSDLEVTSWCIKAADVADLVNPRRDWRISNCICSHWQGQHSVQRCLDGEFGETPIQTARNVHLGTRL